MGYMRHHGIVVTSFSDEKIREAHKAAKNTGLTLTNLVRSPVNGYSTFFVCPDGSKEGWWDSDNGDSQRGSFIKWLEGERYEDGSTIFAWAEIQYGDEDGENLMLQSDETNRPACED